jgi:hypothetical protein
MLHTTFFEISISSFCPSVRVRTLISPHRESYTRTENPNLISGETPYIYVRTSSSYHHCHYHHHTSPPPTPLLRTILPHHSISPDRTRVLGLPVSPSLDFVRKISSDHISIYLSPYSPVSCTLHICIHLLNLSPNAMFHLSIFTHSHTHFRISFHPSLFSPQTKPLLPFARKSTLKMSLSFAFGSVFVQNMYT